MTKDEALKFIQKAEELPAKFKTIPLHSIRLLLYLYIHESDRIDIPRMSKELNIPAYTLYRHMRDKYKSLVTEHYYSKRGSINGPVHFYSLTDEGKKMIQNLFY